MTGDEIEREIIFKKAQIARFESAFWNAITDAQQDEAIQAIDDLRDEIGALLSELEDEENWGGGTMRDGMCGFTGR